MKWFLTFCAHFKVRGKAKIFYKPKGSKNKTLDLNQKQALGSIKEGLQSPNKGYIYHCYNHYMVPVGFEELPDKPENTYKKDLLDS